MTPEQSMQSVVEALEALAWKIEGQAVKANAKGARPAATAAIVQAAAHVREAAWTLTEVAKQSEARAEAAEEERAALKAKPETTDPPVGGETIESAPPTQEAEPSGGSDRTPEESPEDRVIDRVALEEEVRESSDAMLALDEPEAPEEEETGGQSESVSASSRPVA